MKYYWLIFGVLWIVFNFKTITYAQERLTELASLTNKKLLKFSLITFKWAYLSISALVPPASFGFLGGEIIKSIVIFSWILATFGVLKMLSLSRKSLYFQGLKEKQLAENIVPPRSDDPQQIVLLAISKNWVQVYYDTYDAPDLSDKEREENWINVEKYMEYSKNDIVVDDRVEKIEGLVCAVMTIPLWESLQKLSFKPNNNKITWEKDLYDIYFEELDKAKRKSNIE